MTAVVDASVVVAALIDQSATGMWAREQLKALPVAAPQLIMVETTQSLRRTRLRGRISGDLAAIAYADLLQLPLQLFPFRPFAERIWDLRHSVTPYDAWYVALAEALNVPLATLDIRLVQASGPACRFETPASD